MSTYICILDFEATCWNDSRNDQIREIIEFPSVLIEITYKNEINYISEFKKYVKPVLNPILSTFCTELTGITQDDVNNADLFEIVYKEHFEWLNENVPTSSKMFLLTCGHWDLRSMLPIEVARNKNLKVYNCYTKYCNIKDDFQFFYEKNGGDMKNMLDKLKIPLEGRHHSGIDDCKNITKIVIQMINDGYSVNKFQVHKLEKINKKN